MIRSYSEGVKVQYQHKWQTLFTVVLILLALGGCAGSSDPGPIAREIYTGKFGHDSIRSGVVLPDSLVVVSYNIAFASETELAAVELLADPRLSKVDILLLQEMNPAGTEYLARELGLNYVHAPAFLHPHHDQRWGSSVLSKWPIESHSSVVLPHPNPFSNNHRRALAADIAIGERRVRAVSVHLATVVIPFEGRLHQVEVLADSLGQVDYPIIIGGDFNTATEFESTKVGQEMRRAKFRRVKLPAGRTAWGGPLDAIGHELELDHFYYRGLIQNQSGIEPGFTASDHFPIWAIFTWPE